MDRLPAAEVDTARRAIVVGGGFGGIAAALRLRAKGYAVTVVDQCPRLGGRAQVLEHEGFRHDAGPTVLTVPFLFEELFELFGKHLDDYVTLTAPDPWYRFVFSDGSHFDYGPTETRTEAEIARLSPRDVEGYRRLDLAAADIYRVAFEALADQPFHNPLTMARHLPALLRLRSYETVWSYVGRFIKDERLRKAFSIQPLLLGGNPFATTSVYAMINHLERRFGIWFPVGGTGALIDALERLMREEGVRIELNTSVERVLVADGRAQGVHLRDGREMEADIVVANCDPVQLYRTMLPASATDAVARVRAHRAALSMGLFLLFFGARRQWPDVAQHTVWFGPRHRALLADIFQRKVLAEDFSLYVHRPTATDPSFAPPGCDSFYVLCPVPNLHANGIDWAHEAPRLRDRIVAELDRTLLPGLRQDIRATFWLTPEDFRDRYGSHQGTGFSIAPIFWQLAWFRFHNVGEGVKGLYLVGAGTHPGGGIPGVVLSAKVLDRVVPTVAA